MRCGCHWKQNGAAGLDLTELAGGFGWLLASLAHKVPVFSRWEVSIPFIHYSNSNGGLVFLGRMIV